MENEGARLRGRTGTWQFVSHSLLQDPSKMHTLQDDLESSFWTLLYTSLHLIPCSLSREDVAYMLRTVFDEAKWDDRIGSYVGGIEKYIMITYGKYLQRGILSGTSGIVFVAQPLNELLRSIRRLFLCWYMRIYDIGEDLSDIVRSESDKLLTSEAIIQLFKDAYTNPGWSHEIADRQEGLVPETGHDGSSKRPNAEVGEQWRKTQRISRASDATSSRLEMLDE
ncbi:hypothetical protein OE88DRAFT_1812599 [Heliocybe sulcata]|uniref:Fungal-type protein kinase domain-containing protein n=1 Tax=Heliocybe sulcata TaxID=5364 RepID=A0A5C3MVA2_9AGAM|nr:hypothetical protein OE88DRAFT_1812599 [Heliocybe sulcata]